VEYVKPPLSIDQQIDLLISRGMSIPDRDRANRYLSHISYYRLRIYWALFETGSDTDDHRFKAGTSFDNALNLYLFDRKFRLLILEAIERFEISLRTQIVNHLATTYGSHAYTYKTVFRKGYDDCFAATTAELNNSWETWIEHYKGKYTEPEFPPIWSTFEILSFGQLVKWYQIIKARKDRNVIAHTYGLDSKVLGSFLTCLNHIRNIAAHHGRLWNRNLTFQITIPKEPEELCAYFNPDSSTRLKIYNPLALLAHLLSAISPRTSWPSRMAKLVASLKSAACAEMGFPDGWDSLTLWSESE